MPKFVFRFASVLEFRRSEEEDARRKVSALAAELASLEAEIASLQARARNSTREAADNIVSRLTLEDHLQSLAIAERILTLQAVESATELNAARNLMLERRAERKAMETLEARDRQLWATALSKREAAALDEWATMRRAA